MTEQTPTPEFIEFDRVGEVVGALEFTSECLDRVSHSPSGWKWAIIGMHQVLQGCFVLASMGSDFTTVLDPGKLPSGKWFLLDYLRLYRRVRSPEIMLQANGSKPICPTREQDHAVRMLHKLRNGFMHFEIGRWSVEAALLPALFENCVEVARCLLFDTRNSLSGSPDEQVASELVQRLAAQCAVLRGACSDAAGARTADEAAEASVAAGPAIAIDQAAAEVFEYFSQILGDFRDSITSEAVALLGADINNAVLNSAEAGPDDYMVRANQVGLSLYHQGFFAQAEAIYGCLLQLVESFCSETNSKRHTGALHVNAAACAAKQGNYDGAVVGFLTAAEDDRHTYGIASTRESYAMELERAFLRQPVYDTAVEVLRQVNDGLTLTDIGGLYEELWNRGRHYALLSSVRMILLHSQQSGPLDNEFSKLQILGALRNLACLLESELRSLLGGRQPKLQLVEPKLDRVITELFKGRSWWSNYCRKKERLSELPTYDGRLEAALAAVKPGDSPEVAFAKSLMVCYQARNYTMHEVDYRCALVEKHSHSVLGHLLHAVIRGPRYA